MRTAVHDGADAREGRADPGIVCRIQHVAGEGEAEPGAETGAMHRSDGRYREGGQAGHQRVDDVAKDRLAILVQRVGLREVTPAAEGTALATNQQRPGAARLRSVEARGELPHHRRAHRIHLVGPVEHEFGDALLDGQANRLEVVRFRHTAPAPWR
jgi:hypothetical protein